jgi:membrane protein required for beta-lactamase induction
MIRDALLWIATGFMLAVMFWLALFVDWTPPIV